MTEAERQHMNKTFREWERVIKREVAEIAVRATIEACALTLDGPDGESANDLRRLDPAPIVARVLGGGT